MIGDVYERESKEQNEFSELHPIGDVLLNRHLGTPRLWDIRWKEFADGILDEGQNLLEMVAVLDAELFDASDRVDDVLQCGIQQTPCETVPIKVRPNIRRAVYATKVLLFLIAISAFAIPIYIKCICANAYRQL